MSAAAILAHLNGFLVEGSDLQAETPYIAKVKEAGIKTLVGHDSKILDDVDILAVSPAILFNKDTAIIKEAKKKGIEVLTWQAFVGKFLQKDKKVISIAGAHGKSTTTALAGLSFEFAKLHPTVLIGATVNKWRANFRNGSGEVFINEADEFYDNFLNYSPDTIVLTNIEFEHPDYFKSEKQLYESYKSFVCKLVGPKNLIVNQDDRGIHKLISILDRKFLQSVNLVGYTVENRRLFDCKNSYVGIKIYSVPESTAFGFGHLGKDNKFPVVTGLTGDHNIYNCLAALALSETYGLDIQKTTSVLSNFKGIGRRVELIGEKNGIKVYDDYAHHPTEIKATLDSLVQKHPGSDVIAVVEPHSFSRTKAVLPLYKQSFSKAGRVIIVPIYKARDTKNFGVNEESICGIVGEKCTAVHSFTEAVARVKKYGKDGNIVVVMGAGQSHQLARDILKTL
jgi:UDP-N-acetylmuramate--alanine ligase